MEIAEFLLARIAEDEAEAIENCSAVHPGADVFHAPGHPHLRRLAECDARRRIVEWCSEESDDPTSGGATSRVVLKALALPYADHPDYQPEWKP